MTLVATDKHLAVLVSDLSKAFKFFSNEAVRLNVLLARSEGPVSAESCYELQKQCTAEVQAFEEEEPGFREFLQNPSLAGNATPHEIEFLRSLRIKGKRPTPLYYYRELQNLRDPLHFHVARSK